MLQSPQRLLTAHRHDFYRINGERYCIVCRLSYADYDDQRTRKPTRREALILREPRAPIERIAALDPAFGYLAHLFDSGAITW